MSAVRKHSATQFPIRRLEELSALEKDMEKCQLWSLVEDYAKHNETDGDVRSYERLARDDAQSGLLGSQQTYFKNAEMCIAATGTCAHSGMLNETRSKQGKSTTPTLNALTLRQTAQIPDLGALLQLLS